MYGIDVPHILGANMMTVRLELRIDEERRRRLNEVARDRGVPISELVRSLIDEAYDAIDRERRLRAVQEIAELEVEDVPEPDQLSRELDRTYEPSGLS